MWRPPIAESVLAANVVKGACYYVPHPARVWTTVMVLERSEQRCRVRLLDDGSDMDINFTECIMVPMRTGPQVVDNLAHLPRETTHEPEILKALETRGKIESPQPYTAVGDTLLLLNPLNTVPGPSFCEVPLSHLSSNSSNPVSPTRVTPHPYHFAEDEYLKLKVPSLCGPTNTSKGATSGRCIIVSGASGGGITDTSTKIVSYLAWRGTAGVHAHIPQKTAHSPPSSPPGFSKLTRPRQFSAAAPPVLHLTGDASLEHVCPLSSTMSDIDTILHAFLGASTPTNPSSSRYMRTTTLKFSGYAEGVNNLVTSASVCVLQPELSRLSGLQDGHRNFNALYALLAGADKDLKKRLAVPHHDYCSYLNQSGVSVNQSTVSGATEVDDRAAFVNLASALSSIGLTSAEISSVWEVLGGVLLLGNVSFVTEEISENTPATSPRRTSSKSSFSGGLGISGSAPRVERSGSMRLLASILPRRSRGSSNDFSSIAIASLQQSQTSTSGDSRYGAAVVNKKAVDSAARLLKIKDTDLEKTMLKGRSIPAGSEGIYLKSADVAPGGGERTARSMRDCIAKAIYSRLVAWLISKCNGKLSQMTSSKTDLSGQSGKSLTVVEVPGFERLEANGLEQLTRNWVNEKFHAMHTEFSLQNSAHVLRTEGIYDELVPPSPNAHSSLAVIKVLEGGPLSVCDVLEGYSREEPAQTQGGEPSASESNSTYGTGANFIATLKANHQLEAQYLSDPEYNQNTSYKDLSTAPGANGVDVSLFAIRHYGGSVTYNASTFCSSNTDVTWSGCVPQEIVDLLVTSGLDHIFGNILTKDSFLGQGGADERGVMKNTQHSIVNLLSNIVPHATSFCLCLKPNHHMSFGVFDHRCVADQIRGLNVVPLCHAMRPGGNTSVLYTELDSIHRTRYPKWVRSLQCMNTPRKLVTALLWALDIQQTCVVWGTSRLLARGGDSTLLHRLRMINATEDQWHTISSRISAWCWRKTIRRVKAVTSARKAFICLLAGARGRKNALKRIAKSGLLDKWRGELYRSELKRRRGIRRRWRSIFIVVYAVRMFRQEGQLVAEAKMMQLDKWDSAAKTEEREMELIKGLERFEDSRLNLPQKTPPVMPSALGSLSTITDVNDTQGGMGSFDTPGTGVNDRVRARSFFGESIKDGVSYQDAGVRHSLSGTPQTSHQTPAQHNFSLDDSSPISISLPRDDSGMSAYSAQLSAKSEIEQEELTKVRSLRDEIQLKQTVRQLRADAAAAIITACVHRWKNVHLFSGFDKWLEVTQGPKESKTEGGGGLLQRLKDGATATVEEPAALEPLLSLDEACEECENSRRAVWCEECTSHYCSLCSGFVHRSCRVMRRHTPILIKDMPVDTQSLVPLSPLSITTIASEDDISDSETPHHADKLHRSGATHASIPAAPAHWRGLAPANTECGIKGCGLPATHGLTTRFCAEHYREFRQDMKDVMTPKDKDDADAKTQLINQIAMLKKQLASSGQVALEFVSLVTAKERMQEAVVKLMAGDEKAEKDIDKWDQTIRMHPDYAKEQEEKAKQWEKDNEPANQKALKTMRSLVPPDMHTSSISKMVDEGVPRLVAQRVWKFKVLQWVRWHPDDIKKIHIADLSAKYSNQGLDVLEMRAIWAVMPLEFDLDSDGKKGQWRVYFLQKLQELTGKEASGQLSKNDRRSPAYKGSEDMQIYDPEAPLEQKPLQKSTAFDPTEKPAALIAEGRSPIRDMEKSLTSTISGGVEDGVNFAAGTGGVSGNSFLMKSAVSKPVVRLCGVLDAALEVGQKPVKYYAVLVGSSLLLYRSEGVYKIDEVDQSCTYTNAQHHFLLDRSTHVVPAAAPPSTPPRFGVKLKQARIGGSESVTTGDTNTVVGPLLLALPTESVARQWVQCLTSAANSNASGQSKDAQQSPSHRLNGLPPLPSPPRLGSPLPPLPAPPRVPPPPITTVGSISSALRPVGLMEALKAPRPPPSSGGDVPAARPPPPPQGLMDALKARGPPTNIHRENSRKESSSNVHKITDTNTTTNPARPVGLMDALKARGPRTEKSEDGGTNHQASVPAKPQGLMDALKARGPPIDNSEGINSEKSISTKPNTDGGNSLMSAIKARGERTSTQSSAIEQPSDSMNTIDSKPSSPRDRARPPASAPPTNPLLGSSSRPSSAVNLMDAIKARSKKNEDLEANAAPEGGGSDLLAAIKARGGGMGGTSPPTGLNSADSKGDLLSAIRARQAKAAGAASSDTNT